MEGGLVLIPGTVNCDNFVAALVEALGGEQALVDEFGNVPYRPRFSRRF